jgi:uncharacterized phage protein (TIGR01671 family)
MQDGFGGNMREILFRGKRLDNGEWVEGFYVKRSDPLFGSVNYHSILCDGEGSFHDWFRVAPSTVGQHTGLCDKNGKKIFEGDIVKVTDDFGEISSSDCGYGKVIFLDGMWYIDGDVNNGLFNLNNVYYIKVIGNIHDNPELLEDEG